MNKRSLEHRGTPFGLLVGVFMSMLLMVLLIVVIGNTTIKWYDGDGYLKAIKDTLTERTNEVYFKSLTTFDQWFTFVWLIL